MQHYPILVKSQDWPKVGSQWYANHQPVPKALTVGPKPPVPQPRKTKPIKPQ